MLDSERDQSAQETLSAGPRLGRPTGQGSRCSIRFAILERSLTWAPHRPFPSRCARAFYASADERCIVVGDEGASADAKRSSRSLGQCGSGLKSHMLPRRAVGHRRAYASLVASFAADVLAWGAGGRLGVGANGSRFTPLDLVRVAGV